MVVDSAKEEPSTPWSLGEAAAELDGTDDDGARAGLGFIPLEETVLKGKLGCGVGEGAAAGSLGTGADRNGKHDDWGAELPSSGGLTSPHCCRKGPELDGECGDLGEE